MGTGMGFIGIWALATLDKFWVTVTNDTWRADGISTVEEEAEL